MIRLTWWGLRITEPRPSLVQAEQTRSWRLGQVGEVRPNRYTTGLYARIPGSDNFDLLTDLPRDMVDRIGRTLHGALARVKVRRRLRPAPRWRRRLAGRGGLTRPQFSPAPPGRRFMAQHLGPVLDYASPRQRGKLRLPSRSVLAIRTDDDLREPSLAVTETLSGKGRAVAAIAFGVFTLAVLGVAGGAQTVGRQRGHWDDGFVFLITVIAGVWLCQLAVLLVVVNNTWRRTILLVRPEGVSVEFISPFARLHHGWLAENVEEVRVVRTSEASPLLTWGGRAPLGELQFLAAGEPVLNLFTDHYEAELDPIGEAARRVLAADRGAPEPAPAG